MKKAAFLVFLLISNLLFPIKSYALNNTLKEIDNVSYDVTMKQDILCLMIAYPEYISDIVCSDNGNVSIVMKSGRKILYDDKRTKSFDQKLSNSDLQDTMEQIYPLTQVTKLLEKNFDPGRFRSYSLLSEVYGSSKRQVESNLINTNLGFRSYLFNKNNNASISLKTLMKELMSVSQNRTDIRNCLLPLNGTFNYRIIAGTGQLSPHSFGIAIDIAYNKYDYWKWATDAEGAKRLAAYPKEIPKIFENSNFVWGGKWNHFDIMHFEYRPEIILKAKYFGKSSNTEKTWYTGAPLNNDVINNYIEKINLVIK